MSVYYKTDPLADLEIICNWFKSRGPVINRIWIVDRPWMKHRIMELLPTLDNLSLPFGYIPIVEWEWRYFDPENEIICSSPFVTRLEVYRKYGGKKTVWPWVVRCPGVWLEMSDGSWRKLSEEEKL